MPDYALPLFATAFSGETGLAERKSRGEYALGQDDFTVSGCVRRTVTIVALLNQRKFAFLLFFEMAYHQMDCVCCTTRSHLLHVIERDLKMLPPSKRDEQ
jgi:hypothetical protein